MLSTLMRAVLGDRHREPPPEPEFDPGPAPGIDPRARQHGQDPTGGPATSSAYARRRHATADFTEADDDEDDSDGAVLDDQYEEEEDGGQRSSHVLPLFSASHLDSLPVYDIVHAIRIIVQARTETTLSWDQLRSPQVSQFLVKPMQQQIRAQHFSRATLYALMANGLQFAKESQLYPGNAGTSNTRAKVCELLAIKLLKEYTTRELIDALSYDFNPLQGLPTVPLPQPSSSAALSRDSRHSKLAPAARISTLEVAIRASAKHFLAHPLVVQQLEAIWSGAISFYSSADSLHRTKANPQPAPASPQGGGSAPRAFRHRHSSGHDPRTPLLGLGGQAHGGYHGQQQHQQQQPFKDELGRTFPQPGRDGQPLHRRSVTLYDPRNASLFKLSRLRVPRYRQFFSTCSLAVLIGLFLSVLIQHSNRITTLELIFWFWSAGFMLDELVGFNEQGFSLYIMSFWNIFDLGILLLLIIYYSLRICGVFLADAQQWNKGAYDILAANAILLLPRIFSVLDHYQYFSQLLIAFRLMAVDLAAVFVLILVSCSGFFVFFTMANHENSASDVAFRIFQLLMGFTPAAWEVWPTYNLLGKTLMALFLIICHFVVVTILITVLTNSFMAIASNANEEHQFLFAINTISMVKNDALFSYVAPTNIFAWVMTPLRYCMPLPHFVAFNRLVIKVTHLPLLFGIYIYEKLFLAPFMYEPTDLVENTRGRRRGVSIADPANRTVMFSPSIRVREESVVGFQKDRALDEVFRRTPDIATLRTQRRNERRKTQTAIRNWMDHNDGLVDSLQNYPSLSGRPDSEWQRRMSMHRDRSGSHRLRHMSDVRSAASDPADLMSVSAMPLFPTRDRRMFERMDVTRGPFEAAFKDHTDAEGDDELVTNDEEEENTTNTGGPGRTPLHSVPGQDGGGDGGEEDGEYFATPIASRFLDVAARSPQSTTSSDDDDEQDRGEGLAGQGGHLDAIANRTMSPAKSIASRRALHSRALSSTTILYNPPNPDSGDEAVLRHASPRSVLSPASPTGATVDSPRSRAGAGRRNTAPGTPSGQRSPHKPATHSITRPRPILPPREPTQSSAAGRAAAVFNSAAMLDTPVRRAQRRISSFDMSTDTQSELTSAVGGPLGDDDTFGGALPGSFTSQLALATALNQARVASGENDRDRDRMSRLVLARMKTLEESFTDVVHELRSLQKQQQILGVGITSGRTSGRASNASNSSDNGDASHGPLTMAAASSVAPTAVPIAAQQQQRQRTAAARGAGKQPVRPGHMGSGGEGDSRGRRAKGKEVERASVLGLGDDDVDLAGNGGGSEEGFFGPRSP